MCLHSCHNYDLSSLSCIRMYSEDMLVSVSLEQLETAYKSAGTVTVTGSTVTSITTNSTSNTNNDNNNDKYKGYNNDPSWIPSKSTTSNIKTEKRSYNDNNDEEDDDFNNLKFKKKGVSKPYVRPERNNSNSCNSNGNNGNTTSNSGGRPTTAYSKVCIYYSISIECTKPICI